MSGLQNVDRAEVKRYLGVKGDVDAQLAALIEEAVTRVDNAAKPHAVTKEVSLSIDGNTVCLDAWTVKSADLATHLKGCHRAYLLAATLGAEVDRLLARDSVAAPSLAVTEQAVAAAMIESVCDGETAGKLILAANETLRQRFSPGYGDFSLTYQEKLLRLLDAQRRIGLMVTESYMLTPMKSVTAIVGVGEGESNSCKHSSCVLCTKRDCAFRKDENKS